MYRVIPIHLSIYLSIHGRLREAAHLLWGLLGKVQSLTSDGSAVLEELDGMLGGGPPAPAGNAKGERERSPGLAVVFDHRV